MTEREEKIGGVILDYSLYGGQDLYSDGEIEDSLLSIVKTCEPDQYRDVLQETKNWPVLYHLSPQRKNILNWYPFRKSDSVLEIGAGCGAVTGAIADAAGQVTCVELSRKRSLINAWRHRDRDNIRIRVGNFQDIEKQLDEQYTFITLIGVLEYAGSYIESPEPYKNLLELLRRHLAPGGRLLLAIENRLGLKYFSGCAEDHSGRLFDGIEGYRAESHARTFSEPALRKLLGEAGFPACRLYYPWPDYKLPSYVFSDARLPEKGELDGIPVNFDNHRLVLFDEAKTWDALAEDGLFPLFSNSFFVEAAVDETAESRDLRTPAGSPLPEKLCYGADERKLYEQISSGYCTLEELLDTWNAQHNDVRPEPGIRESLLALRRAAARRIKG